MGHHSALGAAKGLKGGSGELCAGTNRKSPKADRGGSLPAIEVRGRQLREVSTDALNALALSNEPVHIFHRGGILARLHVDAEKSTVQLTPLVGKVLRHQLARVADWFAEGDPTAPPAAVMRDIEATPDPPDFPTLDAVVTCPVAVPPGRIILSPGYHEPSQLWYLCRTKFWSQFFPN